MGLCTHAEIQSRLDSVRTAMRKTALDAYLVPSEDAHQSEYIADHDTRRAFVTGFTGSAGLALITLSSAYLWTDGRYFLQATKQLPPFINLMKMGVPGTKTVTDIAKGMKVGIDAKLVSVSDADKYKDIDVVYMHENLVDLCWKNQSPIPTNPIITHPVLYAGKSVHEKLSDMRAVLKNLGLSSFVFTMLDEIAWLFNLRGSDIPFNPVFFSFAIVHRDSCTLYTNAPITSAITQHMHQIIVKPYKDVYSDVKSLTGTVGVDPRCNKALYDLISTKISVIKSPVLLAKAIKNDVETAGMEACHIRDAAALCHFLGWLKNELKLRQVSECESANVLETFRAQQDNFMGLSFDTISGSGPNGAIIHYKPEVETCAKVTTDKMYLLDSGGQYMDGTTDVTRTFHFGTPTPNQKKHYTLVLQSHIAIDRAEFPEGTTGYILDVLARQGLWKHGLDYKHGTGHGVGAYLNVHEGPHGIGIRIAYNDTPLQNGMIVTNEPGLYFEGEYGIRIENVVKCVQVKPGFLGFRPLTLVPMDAILIDVSMLSKAECDWLVEYHTLCMLKIGPLLKEGSLGHDYLKYAVEDIKSLLGSAN